MSAIRIPFDVGTVVTIGRNFGEGEWHRAAQSGGTVCNSTATTHVVLAEVLTVTCKRCRQIMGHSVSSDGRRGRPSTGVKVQVRIAADVLAQIDAASDREGITRAAMVRHIVSCWAQKLGAEQ